MKLLLIALLGLLVSARPSAGQSAGLAQVSGRVLNKQGMPQLRARVLALSLDSLVRGSAYTDAHGKYVIRELVPGRYKLRVAAQTPLPAAHPRLTLRAGARAIVNLTVVGMAVPTSWLPAVPRSADEPDDDWQWTLRSAANRPILRWNEDPAHTSVSQVEGAGSGRSAIRQVAVGSKSGSFGDDGLQESIGVKILRRQDAIVAIGLRVRNFSDGRAATDTASAISAESERKNGLLGESYSLVSVDTHPELTGRSGGPGLQAFRLAGGERTHFGDLAVLDVGGSFDLVRSDSLLLAARPFLRLQVRPTDKLKVGYGYATSSEAEDYDGLSSIKERVPEVVSSGAGLRAASQSHQEVFVEQTSRGEWIRLTYYRESPGSAIVTGTATDGLSAIPSSSRSVGVAGLDGLIVDSASGVFRSLASVRGSQGWRADVTSGLTPTLWLTVSYAAGQALALRPSGPQGGTATRIEARRSNAVILAMSGKIIATGTRLRASYRWQPEETITAVDRFGRFGDQPFLGLHLTQAIKCRGLASGLELTADGTNLLAGGYRRFATPDGGTLFLAQSPRAFATGLAIEF